METPIIIIGLGSSGYHMIKETQKFYHENFKVNKPEHVEYLYIETFTGEKNFVSDSDLGIGRVYTSLANIELMVNDLKKNNTGNLDWLPPMKQVVEAGAGAGGIRPCGRLALWGSNKEGDNFSNVQTAIKYAYSKVSSFAQEGVVESQPVVFIVGTLVGGTASGMFIDMAYLVRTLIRNVAYVFGLYLLPPIPKSIRGSEVKYANAFGSLKELDEYNNADTIYVEHYPSGKQINEVKKPYDYVQFISQDIDGGGDDIKSIKGLVKMGGLFMFLNIAGMYNKRSERLVDALGNDHIRNYGTFGLSGIQYPKDQISEYVACKLSDRLLDKWLDTKSANRKPINTGTIETTIEKKWDEIINEAFEKLNVVGDEDIIKTIELEARKINDNNINENEYEYIKKLFSSNQTDQLYAKVKENNSVAVNYIIDAIYDLNAQTFNKYENLTYAKKTLEAVIKAIRETLVYWKKHNMSSNKTDWENFLRNQCTWMLKNRNKIVLEQNNTLYDRMLSTFSFMKMHLLGKTLVEIMDFMKKSDVSRSSNVSGKTLPKIRDLQNLYGILAEVKGSTDGKNYSIKEKMDDIEEDIKDISIPIKRVFASGLFKKDVENAYDSILRNQSFYSYSKKDITNEDLWDLFKNQTNLQEKLYKLMLSQYKSKVEQSGAVGDYDVTGYVKKQGELEKVKDMAKRATKAFISTDDKTFSFGKSDYLPKMAIASNNAILSDILNSFNNQYFDNSDAQKLEIRELNNILVFYEEKAYPFVPLKDISYIDEMKAVFEKAPVSSDRTDENWQNFRKAYIPVKDKSE